MLAGHRPSELHAAITWKVIEKQLQDLPLSWFESTGTDDSNAENHSPNAQIAPHSGASISKAVLFIASAPETFLQLTHFVGAPQSE